MACSSISQTKSCLAPRPTNLTSIRGGRQELQQPNGHSRLGHKGTRAPRHLERRRTTAGGEDASGAQATTRMQGA
eukprot:11221059-Lingulodinium_polyedra.AAC.1